MIPILQVSAAPEVLAGNIPEVSAVSFCSEHYHLWVSYLSICNCNIAKIDHLSIILFGCTCKGRVLATLHCLSVCITSAKHKKSNKILRRERTFARNPLSHKMFFFSMDPDEVCEGLLPRVTGKPETLRFTE